jgi:DNA-binding transcriptional LysR family regulator
LELRQLTYFVAVAHEESFTRAAERLHVAQPGVSQQIRRLEAELGAALFDRSSRRPRLTAAGAALLPHARDALAASEAGRQAVAALQDVIGGTLLLGAIPGIPDLDLPGLLAAFRTAYPAVDIALREDQPAPLIEGLRRDEHDVIVVGLSSSDPPDGLLVDVIRVEPLVLVTSIDHQLANRHSVSVAELRGESLVSLTRASTLRGLVEQACAAAGFSARIALETTEVGLLCDLVTQGLGVTIVPRSTADHSARHGAKLAVVGFDPPLGQRYTALARRRDRTVSPAAVEFLALARRWLAERLEDNDIRTS